MKILSHWIVEADDSRMSPAHLIHAIGRKIDTLLSIEQIGDAMCGTCVIDTIRVTIAACQMHARCVLDYEATDFNGTDGTRLDKVNATFDEVFKRCGLTEGACFLRASDEKRRD
tara:strand:+ start:6311 stop:6652 length:342 start_codon:yes stop_codon:yes gene_type:complete